MHGGVKVYRGAASAARAYVEADRSRVDDYYLAEGTGVARRFGASPQGGVAELGTLDGDGYERWVAGCDPTTGAPRGRLRHHPNAVRFVEITVNGPKTWSLAGSLHPKIAAAYDAAQDRAAEQIIGWVAEHATTRVGPRGRQVQVRAERNHALARLATDALLAGNDGVLLMADTREQTLALNGSIRDRLVAAGHVDDTRVTVTHAWRATGDR